MASRSVLTPATAPLRRRRHPVRGPLILAGVVALLGTSALTLLTSRSAHPAAARLLAEDEGQVSDCILFLCDEYAPLFVPTQAELVSKSAGEIRFRIVYGKADTRAELERALARRRVDPARVTWIENQGGVPPWARDYFLLADGEDGTPTYLLHDPAHYPRLSYGRQASPASTLAAIELLAEGHSRRTSVSVDGGAVVATADRAFVNEDALLRALAERAFPDEARFRKHLEAAWGLPVEILHTNGQDAIHHCDLYLMPAGSKRLVLGSPKMATDLLASASASSRAAFQAQVRSLTRQVPQGHLLNRFGTRDVLAALEQENRAPGRRRSFANFRSRLTALGYQVFEVPLLLLDANQSGANLALSYTNVIQDHRGGKPTVYLPTYRFPDLDRAAEAVWTRLGYRVVRIDALGPALNGGGLHCLSQVLRTR